MPFRSVRKVRWLDHESEATWQDDNDLDKWLKEDSVCESVGYVVRESEDVLIICAEKSGSGEYGNCSKILKKVIKEENNHFFSGRFYTQKLARADNRQPQKKHTRGQN